MLVTYGCACVFQTVASCVQDLTTVHVTSSSVGSTPKVRRKSNSATSTTSSVSSSRVSYKKEEPAHMCQVRMTRTNFLGPGEELTRN